MSEENIALEENVLRVVPSKGDRKGGVGEERRMEGRKRKEGGSGGYFFSFRTISTSFPRADHMSSDCVTLWNERRKYWRSVVSRTSFGNNKQRNTTGTFLI